MIAYYNENNPYAAQWLRNLIAADLIAPGDVDDRSIKDVQPDDLKGYIQCHFFAGIGGWSYALRLALWPDDRPVWTGSCPCQDFSVAGKQKARSGERHLWPDWFRLIRQSSADTIFGEQVDGAIAHGWLDEVGHDLEGEGYTLAAAVLPAASVRANHIRNRLFFSASNAERVPIQGWSADTAVKEERKKRLSLHEQFSGFLQSHAWPTLSDSKLWLSKHGLPRDVGVAKANHAIGNAIVPQVSAAFIQAYCEAVSA